MKNLKKLTLLHSNDLHGDFLAEEADDRLLGGVSMLSGYVSETRQKAPNTIYAIAGDMFRGSVIDSEYKGISTIEIMNLLAPDVVTIGNHEIDYGISHLLFVEKCAKFPIINANFFIRTNHTRLFKPCQIIERDGMKILFIGVITEEVLAQTKQDGLIGSFVDIDAAAAEVGRICNTYNAVDVDLTVLLTHIGIEEDKKLAAALDPAWGVDIIIGGHSHTILAQPEKVNDILIVQAGTGTDQIGRFDIVVDTERNAIDSYKWQTVPIDDSHCLRDAGLENLIAGYKNITDEKYGRIVTRLARQLTHPQRNRETELGDLFADILRDSLGLDIMLLGSGSVRIEKIGPIITYGDLVEAFPYDDAVTLLKVTGAQLRRMVLYILRDEAFAGHTEFYQFSHGVSIDYARSEKILREFTFEGEPVADDRLYSVGLQEFHIVNLQDFLAVTPQEVEQNAKPRVVATSCREIFDEYLTANSLLERTAGDRLKVSE